MSDQVNVVTMPKLGESVTEGTLSRWCRSVGDDVAFDDPLLEVSTDKVDSEIPSPYDGVLLEVLVQEGETVPVGTPLAHIGRAGAPAAGPPHPDGSGNAGNGDPGNDDAGPAEPAGPTAQAAGANGGRSLSPVVRRLAAERGVDLMSIPGSGVGGRITRADVLAAAAAPSPTGPALPTPAAPQPSPQPSPRQSTPAPVPAAVDPPTGDVEVVPLSRIRLVTAERMLASRRTSPHVWTSVEVDLEPVEEVRRRHKARFRAEENLSLTYLPFIARATVDALRAFPAVNASVDMEQRTLTLHRRVHLAVAVDLDEKGLLAPVVRNADALNLRGLARGIRCMADRAKRGSLGADDLSGSTFTITNPGPLGSYASAAIINQPNVAILSTEGVARRPMVVGDAIAIRHTCILGLSYDHRAFDGVTASRFLLHIRTTLQDRDWDAEVG